MNRKEELISTIIDIEWKMFSTVKNRGGKASCQEEPETFRIIRASNFMNWSEATLESYLQNLEEAQKTGRNLMTEKYARMEGMFPPPDGETVSLINKIVAIECRWLEELAGKSPHLKPARPIYSADDSACVISSETYARGELATYSRSTIELYYEDLLDMQSRNLNRIEVIFNMMVERFRNEGCLP
ncbi:MAG: DUF4125 family protein [Syntrophales bacterium]|nr:DUF4125 family protein [Syntrophales bacterium]